MAHDTSMIFFESGGSAPGLYDAARLLEDRGLDVVSEAGQLCVSWDDGPVLRIVLSTASHVADEAAEIADGTAFAAAMRRCDARFEIEIDDLDEALDEMNTLIEVQSTLQDATGGHLFNAWNEELTAPG